MANITNLPVTGQIKIGGEKVIALNQQNIDLLKKGYANDPSVVAANNAVSNKDLLSQSFAAPTMENAELAPQVEAVQAPESVIEAPTTVENVVAPVENPVQISAIPTIQSSTSIENDPVNMNMTATPIEENKTEDTTLDPLSGLESLIPNTNLNVTPIEEPKAEIASNNTEIAMPTIEAPTTEEKKEETNDVISPFQVSSAPNIFDQASVPQAVSEMKEETNNIKQEQTIEPQVNPTNIFTAPEQNVSNEIKEVKQEGNVNNIELSNDILQAEIALEKEAADLYDKLAQNTRKKIELLEQKKKTTNNVVEPNINKEPSASILFNPNGTLNDNKVFEEIEGNPLKLVA